MIKHIDRLYERLVLRSPLTTLFLLLLILLTFASGIQNFKLDASTDALLLENDRDLRDFREISMRYPTQDFMFLAIVPEKDFLDDSNIALVKTLVKEISAVQEVKDVVSMLDVPLVQNMPGSLAEIATNFKTLHMPDVDHEKAREELTTSPIYSELIASRDGKVTALQITLDEHRSFPRLRQLRDQLLYKKMTDDITEQQEKELEALRADYEKAKEEVEQQTHSAILQIRAIMAKHEGATKLYLGGLPMIGDDVISFIENDLVTFGAGVFVFLVLMLSVIFREARWVILPFASCLYSTTLMVGLLGMLEWKVTVIYSNFIALMLIVTMSMNIHLVVRYRELYRDYPDADQSRLVRLTVQNMARPCLYTALTTIIAFSSLIVSDIKPVIDFGMMMTMGLIAIFLTSFTLFPALLSLTKKRDVANHQENSYTLTASLGHFTEKHGTLVPVLSLMLAVAGITGMFKLEVENSFVSYFHKDTEIHQGLVLIDENLGGTTPLDIILRFPKEAADSDLGDMDDDLAAMFGEIEGELPEDDSEAYVGTAKANYWFTADKVERVKAIHDYLEERPEIGKVLSLASSLRVAEEINGGEFSAFELNVMYRRIPAAIREILVDPYVSFEADEARISARILDSLPDLRRKELLDSINKDLGEQFGLTTEEYKVTGLLVLYSNVLQSLFDSQIETLGTVMVGILIMLMILFRSLEVALVGILPNLLAACTVLGLMGWAGIPLDLMTITIAAITIGIAVDDCIHYLYRYKTELPRLEDKLATMHYCHQNIAQAAFYTTITITAGFSILVLSNFIPTILFGVLTAFAMVIALLAALTLMAKVILVVRPFDPPAENEY